MLYGASVDTSPVTKGVILFKYPLLLLLLLLLLLVFLVFIIINERQLRNYKSNYIVGRNNFDLKFMLT